jgi:hypothetical protein
VTRQVPARWPTRRQLTVLATLRDGRRMTAAEIGVRADVMWRMEEVGWVARNLHQVWHIRPAGAAVSDQDRGLE